MLVSRLLIPLCLLASILLSASAPVRAAKPNVVLIIADDLGYRELGCFGQKRIQTPNLDQLAKQGMRLTQHYAGNAVCAPSRCVLLTGKHPGHAYIRTNKSTPPEGQEPIPDSEVTLPELMHERGLRHRGVRQVGAGRPRFFGPAARGRASIGFSAISAKARPTRIIRPPFGTTTSG